MTSSEYQTQGNVPSLQQQQQHRQQQHGQQQHGQALPPNEGDDEHVFDSERVLGTDEARETPPDRRPRDQLTMSQEKAINMALRPSNVLEQIDEDDESDGDECDHVEQGEHVDEINNLEIVADQQPLPDHVLETVLNALKTIIVDEHVRSRSNSFREGSTYDMSHVGRVMASSTPSSSPAQSHASVAVAKSDKARNLSSMFNTLTESSHNMDNARLQWEHPPRYVLLVKKRGDVIVADWFSKVAQYLIDEFPNVQVFFPPQLFRVDLEVLKKNPEFARIYRKLHTWRPVQDVALNLHFDFCICLGGDGTLLHLASLFQERVPPVLSFALGSLGFLTPYDASDFKSAISDTMQGGMPVTLRMRLFCRMEQSLSSPTRRLQTDFQEMMAQFGLIEKDAKPECAVLNEVVVDRGHFPYLTKIAVAINGQQITVIQGDGLIVATPTGSTAYSLGAGGSMVHPSVPCILITPICPHSVTSRPIIVPASAKIQVGGALCQKAHVSQLSVQPDARSPAFVSFDGRNRQQLCQSESLYISVSPFPVPCIVRHKGDWYDHLHDCLGWNHRVEQKPCVSLDSLSDKSSTTS